MPFANEFVEMFTENEFSFVKASGSKQKAETSSVDIFIFKKIILGFFP